MRACAACGEPTENYGRCDDCTASPIAQAPGGHPSKSSTARGYGTAWRKLSERARRMQPWCSHCGSHDDLTADHSPEAWERYEAGKPIRLQDIDVLCRSCNSEKGAARPQASSRPSAPRSRTRGMGVALGGATRVGEAKFRSQMGTGVDKRSVRLGESVRVPSLSPSSGAVSSHRGVVRPQDKKPAVSDVNGVRAVDDVDLVGRLVHMNAHRRSFA